MKKISKRFCSLLLISSSLLLAIRPSRAQQSPAEKEVRDVLKKFQQGVETGDRTLGTTLLSKEFLGFYDSLAEVYGPAKMVFPFEVGHLKILRDGRAKAEVYLNPAKDLFVFTLTNQDGAWKISHIEGIRFPLYSVPALPYTKVYSLPQEKRSWMMAEEGMAFKSRVYFELKKDRGEESAQKFFLDGQGYKVSMDAWLPFIEGAAQFALYFAILETNYHGSHCTITKASYAEAEIRCTPLTEFEVLKRAFFYPKFSLDEYTRLYTRIMKDRARSCGLMLDITFDCSAYFVKDVEALVRTFEILPEYLKTSERERVNNYRDWGIQLGRRFRALKLWFVIRNFGVRGLQEKIRHHIAMAQSLAEEMRQSSDFELLAPVPLNTICFRYHPPTVNDPQELHRLNARLLDDLNNTGSMFLTHTRLNGAFTLRLVIGQTEVREEHARNAWSTIQDLARN